MKHQEISSDSQLFFQLVKKNATQSDRAVRTWWRITQGGRKSLSVAVCRWILFDGNTRKGKMSRNGPGPWISRLKNFFSFLFFSALCYLLVTKVTWNLMVLLTLRLTLRTRGFLFHVISINIWLIIVVNHQTIKLLTLFEITLVQNHKVAARTRY